MALYVVDAIGGFKRKIRVLRERKFYRASTHPLPGENTQRETYVSYDSVSDGGNKVFSEALRVAL